MVRGAGIGGGIGTIAASIGKLKKTEFQDQKGNRITTGYRGDWNSMDESGRGFLMAGTGVLVGAALGALSGIIGKAAGKVRLSLTKVGLSGKSELPEIMTILEGRGFRPGVDFTHDPRDADRIKTKVCIVLQKRSGDLNLLVNTVNEPELKKIYHSIIRRVPRSAQVTKDINDDYNNVSFTTVSNDRDTHLIVNIATDFIKNRFPVFFIEVGD